MKRRSGLLLVEVLVSLGIVAAASLALSESFEMAEMMAKRGRSNSAAAADSENRLITKLLGHAR